MENNQNRTVLSDIVNMVRETISVASKNSVLVTLLQKSNKNYWNVLIGEDNDIKIELNNQAHNMYKEDRPRAERVN